MGKRKAYIDISGGLIGAGCTILVCLTGTAILAHMIITGKTGETWMNLAVPVILTMASALGGQSARISTPNSVKSTLLSSGIFSIIILTASLIMDGVYDNVMPNIGGIAVGTLISCALCLKKSAKQPRKKKHYR